MATYETVEHGFEDVTEYRDEPVLDEDDLPVLDENQQPVTQQVAVRTTRQPTVNRRALTDEEILAQFEPRLKITADKTTALANGADVVTVTYQLVSRPLNDDSTPNIAAVRTITIIEADDTATVTTDAQGAYVETYTFVHPGTYTFKPVDMGGDSLEVTAT